MRTARLPKSSAAIARSPQTGSALRQATETLEESQLLAGWFTQMWNALPASADGKAALLAQLDELTAKREPSLIYLLTIYHFFKDRGDELDEDKIVKSATGTELTSARCNQASGRPAAAQDEHRSEEQHPCAAPARNRSEDPKAFSPQWHRSNFRPARLTGP